MKPQPPSPITMQRFQRWLRVALRVILALTLLQALNLPTHAATLDDIQSTKTLKVCLWPDYFGISYRNPRTGNYQGIDIDLSCALAQDLAVRLEYLETDFSRVIDDVAGKRCHIAMMAVGVTPARKERMDFSLPYLRSDVYAVATRSNDKVREWDDIDKPGRVVVVMKGTFMEPLMQRELRKAQLLSVNRPGEREREVESGRADVFMADYPYTQRMLLNTDWAKVIAPTKPVQLTDYAYAVAKGEEAWLARVNQFVAQIKKDGRLLAAASAHRLAPIVIKD